MAYSIQLHVRLGLHFQLVARIAFVHIGIYDSVCVIMDQLLFPKLVFVLGVFIFSEREWVYFCRLNVLSIDLLRIRNVCKVELEEWYTDILNH